MDRALWARFGEATLKAPHAIQWLSDNGPQYTATATVLDAHELGLVPLTTPAYSPQSNGLAEAFVKTVKRDYVDGAELRDAESVLAQLSGWIEDYLSCACRDLTSRHGSLVWVEVPGCDNYCDKAGPLVGRRVSSRVMSSRRRPLGSSE
jgi:transposase InsO family protein